jgi:hypothetical protein
MEHRTLTVKEFREDVLPLMIEAGDAPWADPHLQGEKEVYPWTEIADLDPKQASVLARSFYKWLRANPDAFDD